MVISYLYYMISLRLILVDLYQGSDIIYTTVLGRSIIIIDKYETAVELLDKRSGIYSSRYVFVMPRSFLESIETNI